MPRGARLVALGIAVTLGVALVVVALAQPGPLRFLTLVAMVVVAKVATPVPGIRRLRTEGQPVTVRRTVVVDGTPAAVFDRAVEGVGSVRGATVTRAGAGVVESRVAISWRSWGERLTVRVSAHGDGRARVEVVSEPRLRTTVLDRGKNGENVEDVLAALTGLDPHEVEDWS